MSARDPTNCRIYTNINNNNNKFKNNQTYVCTRLYERWKGGFRPYSVLKGLQIPSALQLARNCLCFFSVNLLIDFPPPLDRTQSRTSCKVDAKVLAIQMSQRIVTTQYGRLRGILITFPERRLQDVEAYLGLEYASLLGGDLRFMPPTSPSSRWSGVRTAHKFKAVCPQRLPDLDELERRMPRRRAEHFRRLMPFLDRQQEECLSLNIYVPVRGNIPSLNCPDLVDLH